MAVSVANALRIDPVLSFNFVIKLLDSSSSLALGSIASAIGNALSGGFSECSGLEMSLDIEEYREGPVTYPNGERAFRASMVARRRKSD